MEVQAGIYHFPAAASPEGRRARRLGMLFHGGEASQTTGDRRHAGGYSGTDWCEDVDSMVETQTRALSMKWKWPVYVLCTYPITDYILHLHPWGVLGQGWAKLLLLYLIFLAVKRHMAGERMERFPTHKMIAYIAVLGVAYVVMDTQFITIALAGYEIDFMYMLIALLLPYALTREDVVPMLKLIVFTGFLMALHGVYEYIIAAPIPSFWVNLGEHVRTRVYSLFWSSNAFGSYMAFMTPLAIGVALYEKDRGQRLFYSVAAVFCAATLIFTDTRGAWLAFFGAIVIFTWMIDKRLTLAVLVLALLSVVFVHSVRARFQVFLSPVYWTKTFATGRVSEWEHAYDRMRSNPLFGKGLGRYGGAVASRYFGIQYVDGFYAFMLGETGLIGLLSYLALIVVYLRDVWKIWNKTDDRHLKWLFASVFCAILAFTLHAFVENIYQVPAINMTYWLAGSLVLIYSSGGLKTQASRMQKAQMSSVRRAMAPTVSPAQSGASPADPASS